MAVKIITISMDPSGNVVVNPELCVIERGPKPSFILLMLDESLQLNPGEPGFAWGSITPPNFIAKPVHFADDNIILIRDEHTDDKSMGCWGYQPSIAIIAAGQTQSQTGTCTTGHIRNSKSPVIINR